ncbi:hypothetical protein ABZP36_019521 [Zizania latifolia]
MPNGSKVVKEMDEHMIIQNNALRSQKSSEDHEASPVYTWLPVDRALYVFFTSDWNGKRNSAIVLAILSSFSLGSRVVTLESASSGFPETDGWSGPRSSRV